MNKTAATLLLIALVTPMYAQDKPAPPPAPPAPTPASPEDINYAFGLLIAQSLSTTGLDFNLDQVTQAMRDAMSKSKTRFDNERAKQIASEALKAGQEKVQAARIDKEKSYMAEHGKKKGVVTTASGLQYEVLKEGTGAKPKSTDTVKVDYVGTLPDGTEFDSSIKRGEPAVFPLDQVIPAWTEGLQLMSVGGKYRFTVPSNLGYGPQGAGDVIPPFATLIFEVDLISIEAPAPAAPPAPAPGQ